MDPRITVLFFLALVFVCIEASVPEHCRVRLNGQIPAGCPGSQLGRKDLLNSLLERLLERELMDEVEQNLEIKGMDEPAEEEERMAERKGMDEPQDAETREFDGEEREETVRLLDLLLELKGDGIKK